MQISQSDIKKLYDLLDNNEIIKTASDLTNSYFDEPHINLSSLVLNGTTHKLMKPSKFISNIEGVGVAGASVISPKIAVFKCLMEAYERFSLLTYTKDIVHISSYSELKNSALDPSQYTANNKIQDQLFGWINGYNLTSGVKTLIPAQLGYLYYHHHQKHHEPLLTSSVSTGAAAGLTHESTLLRGIYEVIERDAFMCTYLTQGKCIRLDLTSIPISPVKQLIEKCKRYLLEPHIFVIFGDTGIPTFLTVLIDTTGFTPEVSVSTKSGLNLKDTLLGSFESAIQIRYFMRNTLTRFGEKTPKTIQPKDITDVRKRSLYWSKSNVVKYLTFFDKKY